MFKAARLSAGQLKGPSVPVTIRPTKADVVVARSIARNTAPAPEEVAHALTLGADEKVLLVLAVIGWLTSRSRPRAAAARRQPCAAGHGGGIAAASRFEASLRLDPSGQQNAGRTPPWRPVFRET